RQALAPEEDAAPAAPRSTVPSSPTGRPGTAMLTPVSPPVTGCSGPSVSSWGGGAASVTGGCGPTSSVWLAAVGGEAVASGPVSLPPRGVTGLRRRASVLRALCRVSAPPAGRP